MPETVRGPVADLGATLMHEHVFGLSPEILWNWPDIPEGWDEEARAREAAAKLEALRAEGVDTIVDLTVVGLGRYVPAVQRVAELTSVNIVAATGLYTYDALPPYFANRGPGSLFGGPDRLAEFFVRDIAEGIGRTGVKAAMLKCATDRAGMTPGCERVFRAVAEAHLQTGAPITTHSHSGTRGGLAQQRLLASLGVDLTRVVIGHAGDSTDVAYLEELVAGGSYLGMDRFGIDTISPFEDRVAVVAEMCARGHAGRMVLGHDSYCFNDRFDAEVVRRRHPDYHLLHVSRDVLPELRRRGVTEEQIHQMLVDNPRRVFA
ncbi:MAG: phosphotriesterase-related protein [Nonomuraea muscovyensis]|uniref:Phosphotriesterase-related protein n=1 Tax=Nonomuraea muscovyensis TaxID=1124761 RepID=A0A7X0BX99_9ACTN|nr:phosphotriesterase-related protein [Nonomuraea muscovyensis]MBB6344288.1 phosphotriesterase-related protein [Nonomuraea muscovyensis]MDF2712497.1 phosphotriesterase-related protein [Nonomuraea muscovyensis]